MNTAAATGPAASSGPGRVSSETEILIPWKHIPYLLNKLTASQLNAESENLAR